MAEQIEDFRKRISKSIPFDPLEPCRPPEVVTREILQAVFELLLSHKEYQRSWRGQLQILFGFSPDELDALRQG